MKLHYARDVSGTIVGQLMGPDTANGFVVCVGTEFDGSRTTAYFRSVTHRQIEAAYLDEFGLPRLSTMQEEPWN